MYPEIIEEADQIVRILKGWQFDRTAHGSLFDRGSADNYYGRGPGPHYGGVGGDSGSRVDVTREDERAEYMAGYMYNEQHGEKKDWG